MPLEQAPTVNPSAPNPKNGSDAPVPCCTPDAPEASDVQAALTTWRAQTAPTLPATQVFFIEALARRAGLHEGETRQHLNQKLLRALVSFQASNAACSLAHKPDAAAQTTTPDAPPPTTTAINALTALRQQLDAQATTPARTAWRTQNTTALRATWSTLHAQQRVTHALASKPPQAGPLNSEQLVHRALLLLREVSPDYLRQLVSTVDVLCWGEQLKQGGKASTAASTTAANNRVKHSRGRGEERSGGNGNTEG